MRITSIDELPEPARSSVRAALEREGLSIGRAPPPASKYRNHRITVGDNTFDSKLEYACHLVQCERRAAGELLWFLRQVSFPLPGGVIYRCDYLTALRAGGNEVIDAKGVLTKEFVIKAKQMLDVHGIDILIWTKKKTTPFSQYKRR